jgi:site-specific DNA-methyltransferase (adenine-specific)
MEKIINDDILKVLRTLDDESAQIVIADPPYNIGKDFGNNSDKQPMDEYLPWCDEWIEGCLRVLKKDGTMFIYGFSEILALIQIRRSPSSISGRDLMRVSLYFGKVIKCFTETM